MCDVAFSDNKWLGFRPALLKLHIHPDPTRQLFLIDMAGHRCCGTRTTCGVPAIQVRCTSRASTAGLSIGQGPPHAWGPPQEQSSRRRHPRQVHGAGSRPRWCRADFALGEPHLFACISCTIQWVRVPISSRCSILTLIPCILSLVYIWRASSAKD